MANVYLISKWMGLIGVTSFELNGQTIKIRTAGKRRIQLSPGHYLVTVSSNFYAQKSFSFNIDDQDDDLKIIAKADWKTFFFSMKVQVIKNGRLLLNEEKPSNFEEKILKMKIEKLENLRDSNQINLEQFEQLKLKAIEEQIIKNSSFEKHSNLKKNDKYSYEEQESLNFITFLLYVILPGWAVIFIIIYLFKGQNRKAFQAFLAILVEILLIGLAVQYG